MLPIWIKICGITRAEDALAAAALGVNAIGLVFYAPSPRSVSTAHAEAILAQIDAAIEVYALFVNPSREEVDAVLGIVRVDHLQFHGTESAEFCASFGKPYMKAFRVQSAESVLADLVNYDSAERVLLDSFEINVPGGTGKTFDWAQAATIVQQSHRPIVLAGGLQANNVADAIRQVRPFGVDVSSGVEASPGVKDKDRLQAYVEGVRSVRF